MFFLVSNAVAQNKQFRALLVTATKGWRHESLHYGVDAIKKLGERHYFEVVIQQDPASINDKYLADFQVVIFLNTTGDIFDSAQQRSFERFIRSGKGYVGIHSASDTEYDWEWYTKLVGRTFRIHPEIQTAKLRVLNDSFPGMRSFVDYQLWTDEWYEFGPEKTVGLNYLLAVDEGTYSPEVQWGNTVGKGMGAFHPLSWYHKYDNGRSFYTSLGHLPLIYTNEIFLDHIYGGIYWAATGNK
jgi:type 1 glutamine amidotransferase